MAEAELPEESPSPDVPAKRSGLRRSHLVAVLLVVLLGCVGLAAVLGYMLGDSKPIRLSNPRAISPAGILDHINVDYECRERADPATEYFVIVEHRGATVAEESVPFGSIEESGTLKVNVFGSRRAVAGAENLRIYVEAAPPSSDDRDRVSNVVRLK